jgi:hypothetical protein
MELAANRTTIAITIIPNRIPEIVAHSHPKTTITLEIPTAIEIITSLEIPMLIILAIVPEIVAAIREIMLTIAMRNDTPIVATKTTITTPIAATITPVAHQQTIHPIIARANAMMTTKTRHRQHRAKIVGMKTKIPPHLAAKEMPARPDLRLDAMRPQIIIDRSLQNSAIPAMLTILHNAPTLGAPNRITAPLAPLIPIPNQFVTIGMMTMNGISFRSWALGFRL